MIKRPKILVVDDKPENLFAVETVLKNLDVELVKVTSGNDALKATLHNDFVLALLDIQMPGMDGYELAAFLKEEEKTSKLPIVFISAVYTDPGNIFKGYELGAFSFITKPFQPEILINKVKLFVDKYFHEAELEEANLSLETKNLQLMEAYKELDFFAFSVSHDLRAPLRFINGYTRILKEDYGHELKPDAMELLDKVCETASGMNEMIDALLAYSQLGKQEVRKSEIDMNSLVSFAKDEVLKEINKRTINFEIGQLPPAHGDHNMIKQVVVNLISNAVKFTSKKEEARIEIRAEANEAMNVYSVKDNGVGFKMDYVDKLYRVFQRLHIAEEFKGMGVGLATVKRIVTRHGGEVWAKAEEDKGATFYFSLPKN
jgi:two-component system, sensor histidine kinase and response regulator